jgi:hypothetical protein
MRKLRCVLREHPQLKPCLKRCRHCDIVFLTDFRNAGRHDIDCPFGCRNAHRKKRSTQRSTAYYQTAEGKFKKKQLNARRKGQGIREPNVDRTLIVHLRVVTSLIEGRSVALAEIVAMIKRILRQHSLDKWGKRIYEVPYCEHLPP